MRDKRWHGVVILGLILCLVSGCNTQARYMRGWQPMEEIANRWTGGTIKEDKLSSDEAAVLEELGTPDDIRFFRSAESREPVYEWIYKEREQLVWFVEGKRVEYVKVDTSTSRWTAKQREAVKNKAVTGGFLAGIIAGLAAGFLLLGEDIGLKE